MFRLLSIATVACFANAISLREEQSDLVIVDDQEIDGAQLDEVVTDVVD